MTSLQILFHRKQLLNKGLHVGKGRFLQAGTVIRSDHIRASFVLPPPVLIDRSLGAIFISRLQRREIDRCNYYQKLCFLSNACCEAVEKLMKLVIKSISALCLQQYRFKPMGFALGQGLVMVKSCNMVL